MTCPRCAAAAAATQEYCLQCGLRLPGSGRFGYVPLKERGVALPLALTLAAVEGRVGGMEGLLAGARGLRGRAGAICPGGAPILVGARYCPSCGRELMVEEEPAA